MLEAYFPLRLEVWKFKLVQMKSCWKESTPLEQGVCEEMKDCILSLWNTVILQQGSVFYSSRNSREGGKIILFLKQEETICNEPTGSLPVFASN